MAFGYPLACFVVDVIVAALHYAIDLLLLCGRHDKCMC